MKTEKQIIRTIDKYDIFNKKLILGMLKTNLSANKRNILLRIYNTL
jgi:hypothetical protein